MTIKRLIKYIILALLLFMIASFLFTSKYFIDGNLVLNIKGRILDNSNNGIGDVRIYFSDVDIMKNEPRIKREFIGKTNKDGKFLIEYHFPFCYSDYLVKKWIMTEFPIQEGDFILILERYNLEKKELQFNIKNLKKDKTHKSIMYLEIDEKMQNNNSK